MAWRFMSSLTANTTGNRAVAAAAASVGIVATCSDRPRRTAFAESIAVRGVSGVRLRQEAPPGKGEASRRALSQCKATWDSNLAGRMDPEVQKAADADNAVPWIPWEEQSLAEVRTGCMKGLASCAAESKARYWSQQATVHTTAIPASSVTGSDESTLLLRTYQPTRHSEGREKDEKRPIIMFFHGGGFCICDPIELFDYACKRLAAMTDCVVCSVQYRQAPEHPFPVAPEDCFQATTWCVEHASEFGGDPRRIATCGDSAGGNLAAVVALMARDRGYPDISLQICLCPVTDWDFTTPSYKEFSDPASSPHLHAAQMHWYARRYLQRLGDIVNPWAAPLRAPTLDGVAPGWATRSVGGMSPPRDILTVGVMRALFNHSGHCTMMARFLVQATSNSVYTVLEKPAYQFNPWGVVEVLHQQLMLSGQISYPPGACRHREARTPWQDINQKAAHPCCLARASMIWSQVQVVRAIGQVQDRQQQVTGQPVLRYSSIQMLKSTWHFRGRRRIRFWASCENIDIGFTAAFADQRRKYWGKVKAEED